MALRRMDTATEEDWSGFRAEIRELRRTMPQRITRMLLSLRELDGAFMVDQLTHCLQVATLAERDGAPDDVILAALLHDAGKAISPLNHGAVMAEVIRPVVSDDITWLVKHHQDFQGRFFYRHIGRDPETYRQYESHPCFELACKFSTWDQAAFDPTYDTLPLSHFEPLIHQFWKGVIS